MEMTARGRSRDVPLNDDERAFAEKYYDFAMKRIRGCINGAFKSYVKNGSADTDELTSAALLGYIRSLKALFVSLSDKRKNFSDEKETDMFIRAWISKTVKRAMTETVRKAAAEKRSIYSVAYSLDEPLTDENGEGGRYELVPSGEPSPEQETEFKLLLETLYGVLTPSQIKACRLLIDGYDIQSVIGGKEADYYDIACIRCYLRQLLDFGYIRYRVEDCKRKNVGFDGVTGKWEVRIFYKKRLYNLSKYSDFETAASAAERAEKHCIKGDFEKWYEKRLSDNVFVFPSDIDSEDSDCVLPELTGRPRHSVCYSDISGGRISGLCYNKHRGNYDVSVGSRRIAYGLDREKAVSLRLEAEEHIRNGDFDQWLKELKKSSPSRQPVLSRVYYMKSSGVYAVRLRSRYIIKTGSYGEALKIKAEADGHILSGDIEQWLKEFKKNKKRK